MPSATAKAEGLHVAIIMDGNGRWAQARGWQRLSGHHAGAESVRRVVEAAPRDSMTHAIELLADDGALLRLVGRSELLAVLRDGQLVAQSPEIIVTIDTVSGDVLEVDDISTAQHLDLLALPAPDWWMRSPERLAQVVPSAFGIRGLAPP